MPFTLLDRYMGAPVSRGLLLVPCEKKASEIEKRFRMARETSYLGTIRGMQLCRRWGCGDAGPREEYKLLGANVWLHPACAIVLGEALLGFINKMDMV